MHSRRAIALASAMTLLLALMVSGTATAKTTVMHFTTVGPGVQAFWEYWDGEHLITTNLLAFHQLNAPGTQGYFEDVLVIRNAWNEDGSLHYGAFYDTYGGPDPTISIRQPLAYASVSGTVPLAPDGCTGACDGLPAEVDVSETWTGTGPITRVSEFQWFDRQPGVTIDKSHAANFTRPATLGSADPFDGAFGPLGTLSASDPGVRFFDVHITQVLVCHPGAPGYCEG